jgi:hypothetical protein
LKEIIVAELLGYKSVLLLEQYLDYYLVSKMDEIEDSMLVVEWAEKMVRKWAAMTDFDWEMILVEVWDWCLVPTWVEKTVSKMASAREPETVHNWVYNLDMN